MASMVKAMVVCCPLIGALYLMAAQLFTLPRQIAISSSFAALPGAKLYFFLSGTSTPQDTYQDADLDAEHENPVEADNNGVFPEIYLDPAISYKSELRTSADVLLYTSDPCNSAFPSSGQVNIASSVAGTNTITAALVPAITVYTPEMTVVLTPVASTTGAVTMDLGPGPLPVQYLDGSALLGAEMLIDRPALFNLNKAGTAWVLQNPADNAGFSNCTTPYTTLSTDKGKIKQLIIGGANTLTIDATLAGGRFRYFNATGSSTTVNVSSGTLNFYNGSSPPTGARTLAAGGFIDILVIGGGLTYCTGIGIT